MIDGRPGLFMAGAGDSFWTVGEGRYVKASPWLAVEHWQRGTRLDDAQAKAMTEATP